MVAKAVATECGMCFVSVKGPELLDAYVGESEKNVREVFSYARSNAPCVVFFDELDSLAPARGKGSSGGGVMDRVVSQILAEMDQLSESGGDVYVVGATNRPDLLEPALLRPGRFDRKIYISLCTDIESKVSILNASTRKFTLEEDVDLFTVAAALPVLMSGAGIAAVCRSAYSYALERLISELGVQAMKGQMGSSDEKTYTNPHSDNESIVVDLDNEDTCACISTYLDSLQDEDIVVYVSVSDFLRAASNAKPSISESDLREYEALERAFDDRAGGGNEIEGTDNGTNENVDDSAFASTQNLKPVAEKSTYNRNRNNKMVDSNDQVYM